jgi:hypothetical protein
VTESYKHAQLLKYLNTGHNEKKKINSLGFFNPHTLA